MSKSRNSGKTQQGAVMSQFIRDARSLPSRESAVAVAMGSVQRVESKEEVRFSHRVFRK